MLQSAEPDLLDSESSSDSDEQPKLLNVMQTKTLNLPENYSLDLNNFV